MKHSDISGFHKLSIEERLQIVKDFAELTEEETQLLKKTGALDIAIADRMIENVIGTFELPFGVATNFMINDKDYLIPMVIEEPSVVAAASNVAKMARSGGGFNTESDESVMIGQIQVVNVPNIESAKSAILSKKEEIIEMANEQNATILPIPMDIVREVTTTIVKAVTNDHS